jgi:hypothetical protein
LFSKWQPVAILDFSMTLFSFCFMPYLIHFEFPISSEHHSYDIFLYLTFLSNIKSNIDI